MKNIESVVLDKYKDVQKYQCIGNGVYKDIENKRYVITLRFELEIDDDFQYPLEDILDKYYLNCTDHIIQKEESGVRLLEVEIEDGNDDNYDSLETIEKISFLVGKRVYNKDSMSTDGKRYVELIIKENERNIV